MGDSLSSLAVRPSPLRAFGVGLQDLMQCLTKGIMAVAGLHLATATEPGKRPLWPTCH